LNLWGKGGGIALQDVPGGSHAFLCMMSVVMAVVTLALRRTQPSCAEALAVQLEMCQKQAEC
jgi:hypothetical protein